MSTTEWKGPSSDGRPVQVVGTLFPLLSFAFVLLRTITRWRSFHQLHADDWAVIVAQILTFGFIIETNIWVEKYALGWPQSTVPIPQAELSTRVFYIFELNWALVAPTYKIAVLLLYRRIFSVFKAFNIALFIAAFLTISVGISTIFASIFQCVPVDAFWIYAKQAAATCINGRDFCLATGILSLLIDAYILTIPIAMTWKLHLPKGRKLALTGLFMLGAFVVVAGVVRVYYLTTTAGNDFVGSLPAPAIWSVIEPCVGIISACLPTLNGLFKGWSSRRSKKGSGNKAENYDSSSYSGGSSSKKRSGSGNHKVNQYHSREESEAMGQALQGWKPGQYAEITGSSALGSQERVGEVSSSTTPDDDVERQELPPMTPGPFDADEVNVTTRVIIQKSSANLHGMHQAQQQSSTSSGRPSGEKLIPGTRPEW